MLQKMSDFKINNTLIGDNQPTYIIAELSANHEGSYEIAVKSIEAIAKTGVNAVKIQSYTPDSITLDSDLKWFRTREDSPWAGGKLYDIYKIGQTPWEWHQPLKDLSEKLGLDFFSSPFDLDFVNKLESIQVPAYKIASLEITDIPLIRAVAKTGKPIIISTGAATPEDIQLALDTCYSEGNRQVALLKCTTAYPTPIEEVNLRAINSLKEKFSTIVGLSDHTLSLIAPLGAVALGAKIIEKHFILNRDIEGLDKDFSLIPEEFEELVNAVRNMEKAMGNGELSLSPKMINARKFTRSIFAKTDINQGETISEKMICIIRPGRGLHPKFYSDIIGKTAKISIDRGTPLDWELLN